jgi:hypothetical protein
MEEDTLTLKVGAPVGVPPSGKKTLYIDTDGAVKTIDSAATKAAVGGSSGSGAPITLGTPAATWDVVSGSDLNADGGWEFEGHLETSTTATISLRLNADASNHLAFLIGGAASTSFDLHTIATTDSGLWVRFRITGATGQQKRIEAMCARNTDGTSPNFQTRALIGTYTQTANITSVRLVASAGNLSGTCSLVQTKLGRQL